jgi:phage terminase large subunit
MSRPKRRTLRDHRRENEYRGKYQTRKRIPGYLSEEELSIKGKEATRAAEEAAKAEMKAEKKLANASEIEKRLKEEEEAALKEAEEINPSALSELLVKMAPKVAINPGNIILPAHQWRVRPYQEKVWKYLLGDDEKGDGRKKFAVLNWHRRAGKDAVLLNLIALMTTRRKGMYWHAFPRLNQGRKAIWEGFMNSEGRRMLDYIPPELREDPNQQEMRINMRTGSTYQIVGGDYADALTGSGPIGIGFSEFAQMKESLYDYAYPIICENHGWVVIISTPRGKNHFYKMYQYALNEPGCFAQTLTVDDTFYYDENGNRKPVCDQEYIDKFRRQGKSEAFIRQEFYSDFNAAVEGAVYGPQIEEMEISGRIGDFPWIRELPVCTAWDLGRDSTPIIFFQVTPNGDEVRIIDYYINAGKAIRHYLDHLKTKPYRYQSHFAPWDVAARTIHSDNSVMDIAWDNGVHFSRLLKGEVTDGIECLRANFPRLRINKVPCEKLVDALKSYSYAYDEEQKQFGEQPVHNWASHGADCARYMAKSLPKYRSGNVNYDMFKLPDRRVQTGECPWEVLDLHEPEHYEMY